MSYKEINPRNLFWKNWCTLLLGFFILILQFLGFPAKIDDWLYIIAGLGIVTLSFMVGRGLSYAASVPRVASGSISYGPVGRATMHPVRKSTPRPRRERAPKNGLNLVRSSETQTTLGSSVSTLGEPGSDDFIQQAPASTSTDFPDIDQVYSKQTPVEEENDSVEQAQHPLGSQGVGENKKNVDLGEPIRDEETWRSQS
ncbi:MAG: hypothetical protein COV10_01925 [Candidatus Vogelbacteria bacterium CG10_big_fil_rev_8_21_14_0_10_51_16]|uniref:Uncharacterized protein n=1 Tax=Candidatus Vogelbacteria bacterium CG10_big_fil_rev_8_21_14_0_10_51_16 TaxID=1975045 RepID=A0A2H0RFZ3_9BACT|nr:MAG: hypothetical protein COV10_01925 [Candidatus Vogelbacteria bacterium CG10_big_fil_rev_8_21_14_0_10_51_16]